MSIREDISEIRELHLAIKEREKQIRILRQHYKNSEARIIEFLENRDEPGAMFGDTTVVLQPRKRRSYMSKTKKYEHAQDYIEEYGAPLNQKEMDEFLEAMRGESSIQHTLKVFIT